MSDQTPLRSPGFPVMVGEGDAPPLPTTLEGLIEHVGHIDDYIVETFARLTTLSRAVDINSKKIQDLKDRQDVIYDKINIALGLRSDIDKLGKDLKDTRSSVKSLTDRVKDSAAHFRRIHKIFDKR